MSFYSALAIGLGIWAAGYAIGAGIELAAKTLAQAITDVEIDP